MRIRQMLRAVLRQDLVQVFLILSLIVGILFWKVILLGHVLLPADLVFQDPAWRDVAPQEYRTAQNPLLIDQAAGFYPLHHLAAEQMKAYRRIPLWNPYIFAGQPLVADTQQALFYPPNLLLFWLSPTTVASIRGIFNLLFAGLFTFLLCRRLMVSKNGAIVAAVAFMLSGPMIVWLGWPHANVLACLPFTMWAGEGLLGGKRICLWSLLVGVGMALAVLGGHPGTTFHVAVVFAAYFLARLLLGGASRAQRMRILAAFVLAVVLGVMLSSVQWMPFVDFLRESSTLAEGGRSRLNSAPEWKPQILTAVTLLLPNFYGAPTSHYWWPFPSDDWLIREYQNYNEQTAYFGLVPLALAVGGLLSPRRKRWATIVAVLASLCLGVAWRLPGFDVINYLPLFSIVDNTRLKLPFALLGSLLAGFAFDEVKQCIASHGQENRRVCCAAGLVLASALCILAAVALLKFLVFPLAAKLGLSRPPLLLHLLYLFSFRDPKSVIPAIAAVLAVGAGALMWRGSWRRLFDWTFIAIVVVELLVLGWGYNPTVSKEAVFPSTSLTDMLTREPEPFRVMSMGVLLPNLGCVYRIAHVEGLDLPVFQRFADVYHIQGGQGPGFEQRWSPDWPLVDWMNIKYVLTTGELSLPGFTLVSSGTSFKVYRNEAVLPRAYMVYEVDVVQDDQRALARLTDGTFDFKERAILSSELPQSQAERIAQAPAAERQSSVGFLTYTNDQVTLRVSTNTPGVLVMSDVYAPGWKVRVDGTEAQIMRANYDFRSVFIPEGEHVVTFEYQPLSFQVGRLLSIMGLVIVMLGCPLALRRDC